MNNTTFVRATATTLVAALAAFSCGVGAQQPATTAPKAAASRDEASVLIGLQFAEQINRLGIASDLSADATAKGLKEGLAGRKLTVEEQGTVRDYITALLKAKTDQNYAAATEFLAKNAKEKGVVTTASGLQYRVVEAGDKKAASPGQTDQVTVNYRGTLLDGSQFDSSYDRGQPAVFRPNGVIKGWQEALALMKPGSKWKLWVPPALGYDASPKPGIPGGSLLVFDVELLKITPGSESPTP